MQNQILRLREARAEVLQRIQLLQFLLPFLVLALRAQRHSQTSEKNASRALREGASPVW